MRSESINVLVFGAHPDDCDIKAGGTAVKYATAGHNVRFVSVTNGDAGHHEIGGIELATRRRDEATAAGEALGIEYHVMDHHDGELEPTLERRKKFIREIRRFEPDLVFTHRPNDYHPDHRYTSQLVQDSAFMVTVPNICTDTPALRENPVMAYLSDDFQKPYPFSPNVIVAIDDVIDRKLEALHQHTSQFYEWLPWNLGIHEDVPSDEAARKEWLKEHWLDRSEKLADRFRDQLIERYGDAGEDVTYAEAYEECEYGSDLTAEKQAALFPK